MWIADFLLAQWFWGMTWGFYQIPLTIIIMTLLLKRSLKWGFLQAGLLALLVNLAAVATFTLGVIGIINLMQGPGHELRPQEFGVLSAFNASMLLGLKYAILDIIFFYILSFYFKFGMYRMASIALASNGISALLVYAMQPLFC